MRGNARFSKSAMWLLAVVVLVLVTAGTGYAAHKYVITSTSQISPSVVKALKGNRGPAGRPGLAGAHGRPERTRPPGRTGLPSRRALPGQPERRGRPGRSVPLGPPAPTPAQPNDPINAAFQGNVGFPNRPRRVGAGHL